MPPFPFVFAVAVLFAVVCCRWIPVFVVLYKRACYLIEKGVPAELSLAKILIGRSRDARTVIVLSAVTAACVLTAIGAVAGMVVGLVA